MLRDRGPTALKERLAILEALKKRRPDIQTATSTVPWGAGEPANRSLREGGKPVPRNVLEFLIEAFTSIYF